MTDKQKLLDEVYNSKEQTLYEIHRHIMFLATQEELDEVVRSVKTRRNDLARQLKVTLSKGDSVLVDNRNGRVERGTIVKVNRTKAIVNIENKLNVEIPWDVPLSMIRKEK